MADPLEEFAAWSVLLASFLVVEELQALALGSASVQQHRSNTLVSFLDLKKKNLLPFFPE